MILLAPPHVVGALYNGGKRPFRSTHLLTTDDEPSTNFAKFCFGRKQIFSPESELREFRSITKIFIHITRQNKIFTPSYARTHIPCHRAENFSRQSKKGHPGTGGIKIMGTSIIRELRVLTTPSMLQPPSFTPQTSSASSDLASPNMSDHDMNGGASQEGASRPNWPELVRTILEGQAYHQRSMNENQLRLDELRIAMTHLVDAEVRRSNQGASSGANQGGGPNYRGGPKAKEPCTYDGDRSDGKLDEYIRDITN